MLDPSLRIRKKIEYPTGPYEQMHDPFALLAICSN